jgi:dihydroorotase
LNGVKTLIKGARVIDPASGRFETGDIYIEGSRITAVDKAIRVSGATVIEAGGLYAAPGLVDMHVHLRDPGQTDKEDIATGCRAAAAGGFTSIAAMPNTIPVADCADVIRYMINRAAGAGVRVYPIAAVTLGQEGCELTDFEELSAAGAVAFSDDGRPVMSAAIMAKAMKAAADLGKLVISHCEDQTLAGGIINEGAISARLGVKGLPAAAEEVQVARETALAASYGQPVHIAHVSTALSVALIRDAKRRGVKVTCETCPHYFSLDESYTLSRDADYRMNPPLRTKADVEAIIEGLRDGTIDAIVTDHAPHTAQEKADFETAPNGATGLETSLAAGLTYLVRPGHLTVSQLIAKMSANPARILKLEAGTLGVGSPADITLFDPDEKWIVRPEDMRSKSRNTPYKGMYLYGHVKYTICNGNIVFSVE